MFSKEFLIEIFLCCLIAAPFALTYIKYPNFFIAFMGGVIVTFVNSLYIESIDKTKSN